MSAVPGSSKDSSTKTHTSTASADAPKISSPQPGPSNEEQDSFLINTVEAEEPKAGPSTTAAEFDLEVFDSGSSCSLEDCWSCKDHHQPNKAASLSSLKKSKRTSKSKIISETGSESSSEESTTFELKMDNQQDPAQRPAEMESACPSETEEAISDEEEEEDKMEDEDDDEEDHCQCPKSLIALPPLRLSDVNNHCWKCAGPSTSTASLTLCSAHAGDSASSAESTDNIDEIVQDHDNFGTDENEEDSLDSSSLSSMMIIPSEPRSGFKRKSGEESNDQEMVDQKSLDELHPGSTAMMAAVPKRKREMFSDIEQEICLQNQAVYQQEEAKKSEIGEISEPESISSIPLEPPKNVDHWLNQFSSWSHAQRLAAIDLLIGHCHPTQVRHMMAVIEPQFQRDFISLLPKELALYVLSFLHPRDLLRAAQTCRYWRILAEDNLLWREKCRESGLDETDMMSFRKTRKFPLASTSTQQTSFNTFQYSPWKSGYMRQHNIEINWRVRGIRTPKVLKGHDDHVITCLQFSNNRIVSGSDDNTLKVWNATSGKCMRTLAGHTGGVWSSQMQGNIIVSGSTDRTLKVWNADSGNCLHTLHGHTSTVRCMHLHGQRVVSGSRDATLRMWDIASGQCLHVLMGHVAAVRCVQYDGRLVVSGAYDYMVKVWNPETEECLHTLSGHTNRVYSLQFDGIHVVSGSLDTSIRVWDVETGACKHALMGHQSLTSGMELRNNILVSGNADSTVKVWDITSGQCLQTLSGRSYKKSHNHHFLYLHHCFRSQQASISCDLPSVQFKVCYYVFR